MPLVYSLIARGTTVLVEYAVASGNFVTISREILDKIDPNEDTKKSYDYDNFKFHFVVDGGIIYLALADRDMPRRVSFGFLEDVKNRFIATYSPETLSSAIAYGMNEDFSRILSKQMEYFSSEEADSSKVLTNQVQQTREILEENIDKLIDRHGRMEILVEKTEGIEQTSFVMQEESRKLKWYMWWKNMKLMIIIGIIVLIALAAIFGGLIPDW